MIIQNEGIINSTIHPLETELKAFEARKADLEKTYPGKFVVFKGSDFIGAWDTINAAAARHPMGVGADQSSMPGKVPERHRATCEKLGSAGPAGGVISFVAGMIP